MRLLSGYFFGKWQIKLEADDLEDGKYHYFIRHVEYEQIVVHKAARFTDDHAAMGWFQTLAKIHLDQIENGLEPRS